jgi:hypothetical protein
MQNFSKFKLIFFYISAILLRILPHPPNFTPFDSLFLLTGSKLSKTNAFIVMLIGVSCSNILFSLFNGWPMTGWAPFGTWTFFTYSSYMIMVWLGSQLAKRYSTSRLLLFTVSSALLFWIWTCFGSWLDMPIYPKNIAGLTACYVAGIPYLKNALLGNLFYTFVFFGLYPSRMNFLFCCHQSSSSSRIYHMLRRLAFPRRVENPFL